MKNFHSAKRMEKFLLVFCAANSAHVLQCEKVKTVFGLKENREIYILTALKIYVSLV
jgi:hypothetical protein